MRVEMIGPSRSAGAGRDARPASRVHRTWTSTQKSETRQKRAATAPRRATPVARERNPTTLAQERVPHAQHRNARERIPVATPSA